MFKSFLIALQFLTIVPVRVRGEVTEAHMARSAAAFPLVGALQGGILVAADLLLGKVFHPDLVTALVLLILVLTNGGFHLDGLADTFDGLATKGGRERKLAAMKDSSTGAIGVTAIVFSLAIKYLALRSVANFAPFIYYFSLFHMPVIAKWTMLAGMQHGTSARNEGLGKIFIDGAGPREFLYGTFTVLLFMTLPVLLLPGYTSLVQHYFNVGVLVFFYIGGRLLYRLFRSKFGGLTGDTLGASGELAEDIFLLMVLAWSESYIW